MTTASAEFDGEPSSEQVLELCRLLVGIDRRRVLDAIDRLEDRARFAEHMSRVIGDAVQIGAARDSKLALALAPLLSAGVRETVHRDPATFGQALAPAMGPAIRRAVRQMFESLVEGLEQTLEQTLSVRSWKWRLEARRTGRPLAEVVFLHTLKYRAEHAFWIHRETGLLLHRVSSPGVEARDPELVSAMLTAIQDFVHDAFESAEEDDELGAFQVGDVRVVIEQGQRSVLAIVLRGQAPSGVRETFREVHEQIELSHSAALADFDGDVVRFEAAAPLLERCLVKQLREATVRDGRRSGVSRLVRPVLSTAIVAACVALVVFWWRDSRERAQWDAYVATLQSTPGIEVLRSAAVGEGWSVTGWRDSRAADPGVLAERAGLDPTRIEAKFSRYHAPEPEFVVGRLREGMSTAGAEQATFALAEDGVLRVSGRASSHWLRRIRDLARGEATILRVDMSAAVDSDAEDYDRARAALDGMSIRLTGDQQTIPSSRALEFADAVRQLGGAARALDRSPEIVCHAKLQAGDVTSRGVDAERAARLAMQELLVSSAAAGVTVRFAGAATLESNALEASHEDAGLAPLLLRFTVDG